MRFVRADWQLRQAFPETEKEGIICPRISSVSKTTNIVKGGEGGKALSKKAQEFFKTFISKDTVAAEP